jgi:hypothetical protein
MSTQLSELANPARAAMRDPLPEQTSNCRDVRIAVVANGTVSASRTVETTV